jgi:hypothetical protein
MTPDRHARDAARKTAAHPQAGQAEPETHKADPAPPNSVLAHLLTDVAQLLLGAGDAHGQRLIDAKGASASGGTSVQRKARSTESRRQRAAELGAADARRVLYSQVPLLVQHLTPAQIDQFQRVIDAAAINPGVRERYNEAEAKATTRYGQLTMRDEKLGGAADRIRAELVPLEAKDRRIHLDAEPLFTPELFTPSTDNPDEVAYLRTLREDLRKNGVWLLIGDGIDPRVWLSLGPEADRLKTINAPFGVLTRHGLIDTPLLGANYYEKVDRGPVKRGLEKEADRLFSAIESGRAEHYLRGRIRHDTVVGVAEVSDVLGGADFPDRDIWDGPDECLKAARTHMSAGRTVAAGATLIASAKLTQAASKLLSRYADETTEGAEIAVKWLKRAKTTSEIIETLLMIATGVGVIAGVGRAAATATASEVDILAERLLARYIARNPQLAEQVSVRFVKTRAVGTIDRGSASFQRMSRGFEHWP